MLGPYVPGDRAADLVEVGRFRTRREAEEQALVLLAVGIGCRLLSDAGRVRLLVAAGEGERAAWELATYERENRATARTPPVARPAAQGVDAALAYCAVLLFFFVANSTRAFSVDWSAAGDAQADLIRHGAWWRTLTALSLHGDLGHLASNLAAGLVFGLLLSQLLGWGLAWLAIWSRAASATAWTRSSASSPTRPLAPRRRCSARWARSPATGAGPAPSPGAAASAAGPRSPAGSCCSCSSAPAASGRTWARTSPGSRWAA